MVTDKLLRYSLWASLAFNSLAAFALAMPGSALGRLIGLPSPVPALYTALLGFLVFGFGLIYAWLAASREINRAVLGISAIAKAGVFSIVLALALLGETPWRGLVVASGDLGLALLWAWWLRQPTGAHQSH